MSKEYESIKSDPHLILDVHSEDVLLNRKDKELILDKHRKIKSREKKLVINALISDFFIILLSILLKIIIIKIYFLFINFNLIIIKI